MAKKKANQDKLVELFNLLAETFIERLAADKEADIPTDAATLGVLRQFLKDNSITVDPADDEKIIELTEQLKARAAERRSTEVSLSIVQQAKDDLARSIG